MGSLCLEGLDRGEATVSGRIGVCSMADLYERSVHSMSDAARAGRWLVACAQLPNVRREGQAAVAKAACVEGCARRPRGFCSKIDARAATHRLRPGFILKSGQAFDYAAAPGLLAPEGKVTRTTAGG